MLGRTRALGLALTPIFAIFAVLVLALSAGPASATLAVHGPTPFITGPYDPVGGFNPQLDTNVTISSTEISTPLSYSVTTGTSTTWSTLPASLQGEYVDNTTVFTPADVVAPEIIQHDSLPGYVGSSACTLGISAEQTRLCHQWTNDTADGGWTAFSANAQGSASNATIGNTTLNGQTAITIGFNSSTATHAGWTIGGAALDIPAYYDTNQFGYASPNIADDWLTETGILIGSGASNNVGAFFAVGNDSYGLGTLPTEAHEESPHSPDTTCTGTLPYCVSKGGDEVFEPGVGAPTINGSSGALVPGMVSDEIAAQPWTVGNYENETAGADLIGEGESFFVSISLADLDSPQIGTNVSSSNDICTEPGDAGCSQSIKLINGIVENDVAASVHVTLEITGLAFTTSPITLGSTFTESATSYMKPDGTPCAGAGDGDTYCAASGKAFYYTYDNYSAPRNVLGPYAMPGAGDSDYVGQPAVDGWFSPSWGTQGFVNDSGTTVAIAYLASDLDNATVSGSASATGGTVTSQFPWALPSEPSLSYGISYVEDTVLAGPTYESVTIGTGGQESSVYTGTPDAKVAAGTHVIVPGDWAGQNPDYPSSVDPYFTNGTYVMGWGSNVCDLYGPILSGCNGAVINPGNQTGVSSGCDGQLGSLCTWDNFFTTPVGELTAIVGVIAVLGLVFGEKASKSRRRGGKKMGKR